MKYLEVTFGDNDFGQPVELALKRLWGYMHGNNHHLLDHGQTLGDLFRKFQRQGLLTPMLSALVDAEYLAGNVEFCTRGAHHKRYRPMVNVPKPPHESITERYLTLNLRFHKTDSFSKKWKNSEHAILDLASGEAKTF